MSLARSSCRTRCGHSRSLLPEVAVARREAAAGRTSRARVRQCCARGPRRLAEFRAFQPSSVAKARARLAAQQLSVREMRAPPPAVLRAAAAAAAAVPAAAVPVAAAASARDPRCRRCSRVLPASSAPFVAKAFQFHDRARWPPHVPLASTCYRARPRLCLLRAPPLPSSGEVRLHDSAAFATPPAAP